MYVCVKDQAKGTRGLYSIATAVHYDQIIVLCIDTLTNNGRDNLKLGLND